MKAHEFGRTSVGLMIQLKAIVYPKSLSGVETDPWSGEPAGTISTERTLYVPRANTVIFRGNNRASEDARVSHRLIIYRISVATSRPREVSVASGSVLVGTQTTKRAAQLFLTTRPSCPRHA